MQTESAPLFSIGLVSDTQYAEVDDATNYDKTRVRRYRQSLKILEEAATNFEQLDASKNIRARVILGDILDLCAKSQAEECLNSVFELTKARNPDKWHFLIGNHDGQCFSRSQLFEKYIPEDLKPQCSEEKLYYSISPYPGFRLIFLDAFYISEIIPANPDARTESGKFIQRNTSLVNGQGWFSGPPEHFKFCPFNGGIGKEQLQWLDETLQQARRNREKCVIFCHIPCHPLGTDEACLLFDQDEVLSLIDAANLPLPLSPTSSSSESGDEQKEGEGLPPLNPHKTVLSFIAGHNHDGAHYSDDTSGILHLTLPAPLECAEGQTAYGRLEIFEEKMVLHWTGKSEGHLHEMELAYTLSSPSPSPSSTPSQSLSSSTLTTASTSDECSSPLSSNLPSSSSS